MERRPPPSPYKKTKARENIFIGTGKNLFGTPEKDIPTILSEKPEDFQDFLGIILEKIDKTSYKLKDLENYLRKYTSLYYDKIDLLLQILNLEFLDYKNSKQKEKCIFAIYYLTESLKFKPPKSKPTK